MPADSFPYQELWYFRGISHGNKHPMDEWGGYTDADGKPTDFAEAEHVYRHEAVEMFPHDCWLTHSITHQERMKRWLLVFDVDIHKAPDDFEPDRVQIPTDTAVARSQNGGLHVYMVVTQRPSRGKEKDFELVQDLPGDFDIDIRGEFVKHHVVAPNAIPGVGGPYELVNDSRLKHSRDPDELAKSITLDGEPLLRYNPSGGFTSSGSGFNREGIEPPEDMPQCYAHGLNLRADPPDDDADVNTHKVNVLTALCGLAAGYSTDDVVSHFIEEYYPGSPSNADRGHTEYQVDHLAQKLDSGGYRPPANLSLQGHGILPDGEWCECDIQGHSGKPRAVNGMFGNEVFAKMDTTDDIDMIFDAVASIEPEEIETTDIAGLHAHDEYGCWILVDRATVMDAAQVVGYEMDIVEEVGDYPSGDDDEFWRVVAELRERGAAIPRYTGGDGPHPDEIGAYDSVETEAEKRKQILKQSRSNRS
jgi:hypothetical protein